MSIRAIALLLVFWSVGPLLTGGTEPLLPTAETPAQREARLSWGREGRFGLFIHWGPSSLSGKDRTNTVVTLELDGPASAEFRDGKPLEVPEQVTIEVDSPRDYQVFQRQSAAEGLVRVAGKVGGDVERVEAQLDGDWHELAFDRKAGTFEAESSVPTGGWHVCRVRAWAGGAVVALKEIPHVGVGEVFVVAGQSNSANHGEERQSPQSDRVTAFDGVGWRPAHDPQPGASGDGGSFIPPFGEAMAARLNVPVGFVACGIGATSVREWLPRGATFPHPPTLLGRVRQLPNGDWESQGAAFEMLTARMRALGPRGFRAVLWHQGESDANQPDPARTLPGDLYRRHLEHLIRDSRSAIGWEAPWFVAQVSYHGPGDEFSPEIRAAQKSLWDDGVALEGPDTDALKGSLRDSGGRGVHFGGAGLREHAARWVEKVAPWLATRLANRGLEGASAEIGPWTATWARGAGYPDRDPNLDALPGFRNPPPGYGEVPFWWWTGDPLDVDRLTWQLDQLHQKGISGVQVNYAHEDTPGWPTYAAEPPIFSDAWWRVWGQVVDACRQRGMGIGLSTYTLDWPGADNLFRRLFTSRPELNALRLEPLPRQRFTSGQSVQVPVPSDLVAARAYPVKDGQVQRGGVDLRASIRDGRLEWTPDEGEWELWLVRAERQANTLNPLLTGIGDTIIRDFYQRFQEATPNRSAEGLDYFFNDELHIGAGARVWNSDFADEFQRRKGYNLFEVLPALWADLGPVTPKVRIDYADVRMALMEERYFQPIYQWHASRGLIFACDSGGRGLQPDEFGDYFRATRWYSAPGHDTPGGHADLIKGKVSSSIASLYRRPRVWLEGYHSLGWGATPERLMFATRENYLYGCTLLNLHGLYYSTHGSFWEWAPPCYHFRMPYWEHMGVFLKYFERLSYLLSQGTFVADVAVLYPVASFEAGLDGGKATQIAFDTGRALLAAGVNFEFLDADSLARATVGDARLATADSSYRALVFPAMEAARWSSLQKAAAFAQSGGLLLSVGTVPSASDRAGRDDPDLDALVAAAFPKERCLEKPVDVPARVLGAFVPDTRADPPVRSLHRKVGSREVYLVMDAPKHSTVEFRAQGQAEWWDPWTGATHPLRVLGQTATGTRVEMPLEAYEAQVIVFRPGSEHTNPPPRIERTVQRRALDGDWEFALKPTMDNRYGDFRLPATDRIIGPEARMFRHAVESSPAPAWHEPGFDDHDWERVTYDFGPQFWVLGPVPPATDFQALDQALAQVMRLDSLELAIPGGETLRWRPYELSWRQGFEGDTGHQGWHGLKEKVTDHFLCLGKRGGALNEFKYEPEIEGGRYYLWTCMTVDQSTSARFVASESQEGVKPHASAVLTPAAIYVNGQRVDNWQKPLSLRTGPNPILVRYDHAGRGYLVVKRDGPGAAPAARTPLSMTWFDDPALVRFDIHAGAAPAEWFRFLAPPGLRAIRIAARGKLDAWADGQPMRASGFGRFEATGTLVRPAVVALRVQPERGFTGAAVFPEPVRLECGPGVLPPGDWSKSGVLECYSGGALYGTTLVLSPEEAEGEITLDLGKVVATAEVRVNGQLAGIRVAPPWRVEITPHVKPGGNRIEVLVYNTLANHYSTIPTRYRGELTSGLLGPVAVEVSL